MVTYLMTALYTVINIDMLINNFNYEINKIQEDVAAELGRRLSGNERITLNTMISQAIKDEILAFSIDGLIKISIDDTYYITDWYHEDVVINSDVVEFIELFVTMPYHWDKKGKYNNTVSYTHIRDEVNHPFRALYKHCNVW